MMQSALNRFRDEEKIILSRTFWIGSAAVDDLVTDAAADGANCLPFPLPRPFFLGLPFKFGAKKIHRYVAYWFVPKLSNVSQLLIMSHKC